MPEKSVREMSSLEKKHYSLEARTFYATLMGCFILGTLTFVIGLILYTSSMTGKLISEAFNLSRSAAAILQVVIDVEPFTDEVMAAYRTLDEEELAQTGTEEYHARFEELTTREDYVNIRRVLDDFADSSDISALYLAMYDRETSAMVYLVDPEENRRLVKLPCDWDLVTRQGLDHFMDWDGEGELYEIERTPNYGWMCTSGVPIRNEQGEPVCFVLADISLSDVKTGIKVFALHFIITMIVLVNLVGFIMSRHFKKTLVKPINAISEAAQQYVKDRSAGKKDTDHFALLNIRTGDEVENLSLIMADMEQELAVYEDNLTRYTAEKERILTELELANRIQAAMVPHTFPAFPDRKEFDIYATMKPAREVGGDFYDFFLTDDDHLCMVMADVSGKGIPAALFMMASKIILANNAMSGKSPARILTDTNTAICSNNQEEMFVTVWLGILEISTGKLTAASAGHEYPVLKKSFDSGFELLKDKHGFVIGGMDGVSYKEYELTLEPGAKLFLYTDGVPEATDTRNRMFGTERMLEALNEEPDAAPEKILQNVRKSVDGFVRLAEQFDDLTMLCMEYTGDSAGKAEETGKSME